MRYTRKVLAVCMGTAVAMVASLLVAVLPAQPALADEPMQNPGGDMTMSLDAPDYNATAFPYNATDFTDFSKNVAAPFLGLPGGSDPTAVASALYALMSAAGFPPSTVIGDSPKPPPPPDNVKQAATVTVTPSNCPTQPTCPATVNITIPEPSIGQQIGAGVAAFAAGQTSLYASFVVCGMFGARGLLPANPGETRYQSVIRQRPGLVDDCLMYGFGVYNLAQLAVNDAVLGVNLKSLIWVGILIFAALDGVGGKVQNLVTGWLVPAGGFLADWLASKLAPFWDKLRPWFVRGSLAIAVIVQSWISGMGSRADIEHDIELQAPAIGANAEGVGTIYDGASDIQQGLCVDGGYGHPSPLVPEGSIVAINTCNANPNQQWVGWGTYNCPDPTQLGCGAPMQVTDDGLCLSPQDEAVTGPQPVKLAWCDGTNAQLWYNGLYGLRNVASGLCLDDPGFSVNPGTQLHESDCTNTGEQFWHGFGTPRPTHLDDGRIESPNLSACADAYGGNAPLQPGQIVAINFCNGNTNQDFRTWNNGWVTDWGLCMDTTTSDQTTFHVVLKHCSTDAATQQWVQSGSVVRQVASGLCLSTLIDSPPPGWQLGVEACQPLPRQVWVLPGHTTVASNNPRVNLRVLPFGDSITSGFQSSDGSGYRCDLGSDLSGDGYSYQMVGSLASGTKCAQTDHEGHSGWTISQLQGIEKCSIVGYQPNVVLLDIRTNDINSGGAPATAAGALESLVNSIFTDDPGVTVLVAGLILTNNSTVAANMTTFNNTISGWITQQQGAGKHILFVNMSDIGLGDLADGLHPNDTGYAKMASNWHSQVANADVGFHWIKPANAEGNLNCTGTTGTYSPPVWYPQGTIATGPGSSATALPGNLVTGLGDQVVFADMNGDGRDDLVIISAYDGSLQLWLNGGQNASGNVTWIAQQGPLTPVVGGDSGSHIRIADMNGDLKADYVDVADNSSVKAWINGGARSTGGWNWTFAGTIASGVGAPGSQVQFADMDNDQRADYLVVSGSNGKVQAWLNGGAGCGGWCWYPKGTIASGGNGPNPQFPDLQGDGRADYVDVNSDSSVVAWLNPGLNNLSNGVGWVGKGTIATGVGVDGSHIRFGDITGDGRDDYLDVDQGHGVSIREWQDGGAGCGGWCWNPKGTITNGAYSYRIQYADMNSDGRADYLGINDDGSAKLWLDGGPGCGGWCWYPQGQIASGVGDPGSQIIFADINGGGKADYLDVDSNTGALQAWLNGGPGCGGWCWYPQGTIATGVGAPGSQIRFADINGDGRADYVNLQPNGAMDVWVNGGAGCGVWCWYPKGTIATGVGDPGSHIRLADINGDGEADYIDVADNSSANLWLNGGPGCGNWCWYPKGTIASGVGDPGSWIQFADINGDHRADYLSVNPVTGTTRAWLN